MRIISGNLKGKSLEYLKNSTTRPLKDSVKENIFNIITHSNLFKINLEKSSVLDLYSGIGSFGLECISRGSKNITFVEKDKNTLKILEGNLRNLGIENKALIIKNEDPLMCRNTNQDGLIDAKRKIEKERAKKELTEALLGPVEQSEIQKKCRDVKIVRSDGYTYWGESCD